MENNYNNDFLNELRIRCDIEKIVSRYVQLKKSSTTLLGLCPFHNEKTPSFHVNPQKQFFHCFGCGAGGDVITFMMKIENLTFTDAIKMLADSVGLNVPKQDHFNNEVTILRKKVFELNRAAAKFYHENLKSEKGQAAYEYLTNRGILPNTIVRFGLGYSLDSWDGLLKYLLENGFTKNEIKASGVCVVREERMFDFFRNRVMFPIFDYLGNVIGFGGRIMGEGEPKYLNSSDNVGFTKGKNLYAINYAKNTKTSKFILCEGYMDVIALNQAGYSGAVAGLGTAFTADQARLLKRFCGNNEIYICYDNDNAGKKAALRAIDTLNGIALDVKVIRMTGAKDPDEFLKKFGKERFDKVLDGSLDLLDYKIEEIRYKYNLEIEAEKVQCLNEIINLLANINNHIEREIYTDKISKSMDITKEAITAEINVKKRRINRQKLKDNEKNEFDRLNDAGNINPQKIKYPEAVRKEEELLSILFNNPELIDKVKKMMTPDDFVTDFNKNIFNLLSEKYSSNIESDPLFQLTQYLEPDQIGKISKFVAYCESLDIQQNTLEILVANVKNEKKLALQRTIGYTDENVLNILEQARAKRRSNSGNK